MQPLGRRLQLDRLAVEAVREALCALHRAVGDRDARRRLRREMGRAKLDHLAGADEEHLLVLEARENARASFTAAAAMDTVAAPTLVVLRTSLATAKVRWNSLWSTVPSVPADSAARAASFIWPRIWGSPSTIESRPEATRKAWRTACSRGSV